MPADLGGRPPTGLDGRRAHVAGDQALVGLDQVHDRALDPAGQRRLDGVGERGGDGRQLLVVRRVTGRGHGAMMARRWVRDAACVRFTDGRGRGRRGDHRHAEDGDDPPPVVDRAGDEGRQERGPPDGQGGDDGGAEHPGGHPDRAGVALAAPGRHEADGERHRGGGARLRRAVAEVGRQAGAERDHEGDQRDPDDTDGGHTDDPEGRPHRGRHRHRAEQVGRRIVGGPGQRGPADEAGDHQRDRDHVVAPGDGDDRREGAEGDGGGGGAEVGDSSGGRDRGCDRPPAGR